MSFQPTRRQTLAGLGAGLAALALAGCGGAAGETLASLPGPLPKTADSLNAMALRGGRRFGSCVGATRKGFPARGSFENPAYGAIIAAECGIVVPENEMKWQWTRPGAYLSFLQVGAFTSAFVGARLDRARGNRARTRHAPAE